jgi:hypothetical protein
MDREPDVLQHRVEVLPLEWRRIEPGEGIGREERETAEGRNQQALGGKDESQQVSGQLPTEDRDRRAHADEDQHPEHHRAFVVAPDGGDPEDRWRSGIGMLIGQRERKIRGGERLDERGESRRH